MLIQATNRTSQAYVHSWPQSEKLHMVPYGFVWPSGLTVNILWNLWFFGDFRLSIGPYRHIHSKDDLVNEACKVRRAKCLGVVNKLVDIAKEAHRIQREKDIVPQNSQEIFSFSFDCLSQLLYDTPRRPEDLVVDSVYERMRIKFKLQN